MTKSIHHQFFFPHPPEVVWEYLTKAELIKQWLMENDFEPKIGHDFQFRARPMPNLNFDGIVYCKLVEMVPFKRLSYSWKCGPGNGKITLDSLVLWKLIPKDDGTELLLEHSGFTGLEDAALYTPMHEGWFANMKKIAELINIAKHGATNS